MPNLEHPKVVRATYVHRHHTVPVINTLHWYYQDTLTQAVVNEFAATCHANYFARLPDVFSYQMKYLGLKVRQRVKAAPLGTDVTIQGGVAGNISYQANRPAEAVSLKLTTAAYNRSGAGTWFGGGVPDNTVNQGLLDDSYRTAYATLLENYLVSMKTDASGWTPVVFSQQAGRQTRVNPVLFPITGVISVTLYPAHLSTRNVATDG